VLYLMTSTPAAAAESTPDELYRKGRFAEAEKGYAQADMDNPKDLRYRYNRGCAAFQSGDYQAAAAAFASVLRRSADDDIRFKAAYNLGNTTYQQGDYQAAAKHYKQAIANNPSSPEARYNLELALQALQKKKEQQSEQSQDPSQQDTEPQQDKSDAENKNEDKDRQSDDKSSDQDASPEQQKANESEQSEGNQEKTAEQPSEKNSRDAQQSEQKSQQELAGELKPREGMPPAEADEQTSQTRMTLMDQKKAEALLDNIQEDRSQMMRLQNKGQRQGVPSGKGW
jgi:Ca-activated chloride channel family protein